LSNILDNVQAQVATRVATPDLAELKSALDDLRLRTWSLLMATNADDPHAFQEQFRTHRGTEMCRALTADLRTGKLSARQPDLPGLGAAARELAAVVKEATRKPPRRRGKDAG
jgi:DNA-binding transcriptional regulator YbjK